MSDLEKYGKNYEFDRGFFTEPKKIGRINIFQVGEVCIESKYEIMPHHQGCHEITYVVSGTGQTLINGKPYPVNEHDVVINRMGEYHSICSSDDEKLRFFYLGFTFEDVPESDGFIDTLSNFFEHNRESKIIRDRYDIRTFFLKMLSEFYHNEQFSDRIIKGYLEQILLMVYRNFISSKKPETIPDEHQKAVGHTTYAMIKFIEENVMDIDSLTVIAVHLGYSYKYLSHLFKRKTGMTLQGYLNYKKMEKAIEIIDSGAKSITEIAEMLNYDTVQSFSRAFKRTMKVSPSEYRKSNQETREFIKKGDKKHE